MSIWKPFVEGNYSRFYTEAQEKKNERDRCDKRTRRYLSDVKRPSRIVYEQEREEQKKRREEEERKDKEDRLDRERRDDGEPERGGS